MARRCAISGTKPLYGNRVSHAQNKTRRRFLPNLQKISLWSDFFKKTFSLRVTVRTVRTLDKFESFDAFLLKTSPTKLSVNMASLGRKLRKSHNKVSSSPKNAPPQKK